MKRAMKKNENFVLIRNVLSKESNPPPQYSSITVPSWVVLAEFYLSLESIAGEMCEDGVEAIENVWVGGESTEGHGEILCVAVLLILVVIYMI